MSLLLLVMVMVSALRAHGQAMPDVVCVGETKHYWVDPNPVAGSTYTWQINGVTQVSTTNEIYVTWDLPYTPAGSPYTITVQEKSAAGCYGDVKTGQVQVNAILPVSVSVTASQNPACSGVAVTFTANVINGGTSPSYNWILNGSPAGATSGTYTYMAMAGDVVSCEVNSNAKCVVNNPAMSAPVTMQVNTSPVVTFVPCYDVITSVEAKPFKLKGGLPLNGSYSGGGIWVNNPDPGMFNPQVAPTGPVPVTYTYTNADGCSGSAVGIIQNNPAPVGFICGSDWTDIRDGKIYPTVQIGSQCWLAENLNYGTKIQSSQVQSDNCVIEKYCYNNDPVNCSGFGGLYQWDELMRYDNTPASQGICPPGWHVPVESEWNTLLGFYGGNGNAGDSLQNPASPGFHALPGGVLYLNNTWSFKGLATLFWSSTPAGQINIISHGMNNIDPSVSYYESARSNAFPVRCLRD